ncbi:MAG: hypothetical protein P4L56_31535 [Candidatus Sulfopaludibacter sp.]|nr:hypothetical protein [Candidatus Sulfopaludibacter sp.]
MTSRALCNHILLPVAIAVCASLSHAQSATTTQILQTDPSIVYTGTWYPNYETPNIGGSATLTNDKGAAATLSFTGTGIAWIGVLDPYSGLAQVYLDGTPNTVDTYGPTTLYQQSLFSVHGLAPGAHTLSIQVLHQRDGQTNGSWIWINAFNIENGSGIVGGVSAPAGRIEQNNPAVSYAGNWYLNTNPIMSGGTAALAVDANSSVTVTFNGTGITNHVGRISGPVVGNRQDLSRWHAAIAACGYLRVLAKGAVVHLFDQRIKSRDAHSDDRSDRYARRGLGGLLDLGGCV